jgi:hypothetical protein
MATHTYNYHDKAPAQTDLERLTKEHAEQPIDKLLPESLLVKVRARNVPGKVLWVDYDAAKRYGFDVPADHRMTPEFHEQLINALSFKVATDDAQSSDTPYTDAWADRYVSQGSGGSGRAIFVKKGDTSFCIKGAGVTPLAGVFAQSSKNPGTCSLRQAIAEAVMGKLSHNLFTQGGTGVLAILDVGDRSYDKQGKEKPRALIVRYGNHIRPAHVLNPTIFMQVTGRTLNAIAEREKNAQAMHPKKVLMAIGNAHAYTQAEQLRWRVSHGMLHIGNSGLFGEMLDHDYTTTQARTAPVHGAPDSRLPRGTEAGHLYRTERFARITLASRVHEDSREQYRDQYGLYKDVSMLRACGMKKELAEVFAEEHDLLAKRFRKQLMHISKYYNSGPLDAGRSDTSKTSIVDIFHLLGKAPSAVKDGVIAPETIKALLKPVYDDRTGITGWRQRHVVSASTSRSQETPFSKLIRRLRHASADRRQESSSDSNSPRVEKTPISKYRCTEEQAKKLIDEFSQEFSKVYPSVIRKAQEVGVKKGLFADQAQCLRSIQQRAEFENRPIDKAIRFNLSSQIDVVIAKYAEDNNRYAEVIQKTVDEVIADSLRNVDQIVKQGEISVHDDHLEIQKATIDSVSYGIRIDMNGEQHLNISIPLPKRAEGLQVDTAAGGEIQIIDDEGAGKHTLRLMLSDESEAIMLHGKPDPVIGALTFSLPLVPYTIGQVRGDLLVDTGTSNANHVKLSGYVFAAPDHHEIGVLTAVDQQAANLWKQMTGEASLKDELQWIATIIYPEKADNFRDKEVFIETMKSGKLTKPTVIKVDENAQMVYFRDEIGKQARLRIKKVSLNDLPDSVAKDVEDYGKLQAEQIGGRPEKKGKKVMRRLKSALSFTKKEKSASAIRKGGDPIIEKLTFDEGVEVMRGQRYQAGMSASKEPAVTKTEKGASKGRRGR